MSDTLPTISSAASSFKPWQARKRNVELYRELDGVGYVRQYFPHVVYCEDL